MKKKIKKLLRKLHLYNFAYKVWGLIRGFGRPAARRQKFFQPFDSFVAQAEQMAPEFQQQTVLFHGYLLTPRKQFVYDLAEKLIEKYPEKQLLFLLNKNSDTKKFNTYCRKMLIAPHLTLPFAIHNASSSFISVPGLVPTKEMKAVIAEKPYLQETVNIAAATFEHAGRDYLEVLMYETYRCYCAILDNMNVAAVGIWNAFKYNHFLFAEMCKERGIPVSYIEFGSLPGTLVIDEDGQMGESWPARHPEEFRDLPVAEEELEQAGQIIDFLRESGINRKAQPAHEENDALLARMKPGRPIVMFAGQCDRDSGMIPYTERVKTYHSPCFESSMEAMIYLAGIAEKHDWNYIFKPHPMDKDLVDESRIPKNVIFIRDININDVIDLSDVVVTILSSTVYVSLVRGTATVMLGYNQIHGKGCVYEALRREDIEAELVKAVENGYTATQREAFRKHVAQMCRYYLYSDCVTEKAIPYGKPLEDAVAVYEKQLGASSEAENETDTDKCAWFFCESAAAVLSAIHISRGLPSACERKVLLIGKEETFSVLAVEKLMKSFSEVRCFDPEQSDLSFLDADVRKVLYVLNHGEPCPEDLQPMLEQYTAAQDALMQDLREKLEIRNCTDVYIGSVGQLNQAIVKMIMAEQDVRLHLFDVGRRLPGSRKSLFQNVKAENSVFTKDFTNLFCNCLCEVILYNYWEFDSENRIIRTMPGQRWNPDNGTISQLFSPDRFPAYRFIEEAEALEFGVKDMIQILKMCCR